MSELKLGARYRLDRQVSAGGMGEVWAADDELLGRRVAVKLLRHELAAEPGFRDRFRAEARAAAALAHPNVVAVYDYGEHDGIAYLAMELVDGEPLSSILRRRGRLHSDEAMSVVAQTAAALSAAHAHGLVHRDVKPANILVRPDGRLAVTDFGIARSMTTATRTDAGTVLGTVAYMSPEQVRGEKVTPASDLYSLGVVAFECLSGRRPFAGGESITVALAHLHDPVPDLPADVAPRIGRLVRSMLAKDPRARPASAMAVSALARELVGTATPLGDAAGPLGPAMAATDLMDATLPATALGAAMPATDLMDATLPATALGSAMPVPPEQPPNEHARHHADRRRVGVALAGAAAAVVIVLAAVMLTGGGGTPSVTMPKVTGRSLSSAEQRLTELGLRPTATTADAPAVVAETVLSQRPVPGGRVRRGSQITLTVASGFVSLAAKSLDGLAQATAVARLRRLGFADTVRDVPSSATTGSVVGVAPTGRLAVGTTVTLTVASAIPPTTTTTAPPPTTTTTTAPAPTTTTAPAPATTAPAPTAPTQPAGGGPGPGGPPGHDH